MIRSPALAAVLALICGGCVRDKQRAAPVGESPDGAVVPAPPVGSGLSASSAAATSSRPGGREACRVGFSGAEESHFVGMWRRKDDGTTAASDYWATDAEVRTALRTHAVHKEAAEVEREIDARMGRDPRLVILAVSCTGDGGALVIVSSDRSKYADIPFAPGTYKLGTGTVKSAPAGEFAVLRIRSSTTPYVDVGPGTLTLTKFDATGVAGSFSFTATSQSTKAQAKIEGTFDLPCEPSRFGRCQIGG